MARASNTLSVSEYEKILLGNKTSVLRTDLGKSLEDFCAIHQKLVVDLLEKTPRISKNHATCSPHDLGGARCQ